MVKTIEFFRMTERTSVVFVHLSIDPILLLQ